MLNPYSDLAFDVRDGTTYLWAAGERRYASWVCYLAGEFWFGGFR